MIIGLTGKNAAGKGETAKRLQKLYFHPLSLSDELREEATRRGIGHSREELIALGKKVREEHGTGYLASRINEKISILRQKKIENFVVDSIRNPGEVHELAKNVDFRLVAIEALPRLRYERMRRRARQGDASTFEQFLEIEKKENSKSGAGQQLDVCIGMAAHTIENNGTFEELWKNVDKLVEVESWLE